jgi:hypothetical protein
MNLYGEYMELHFLNVLKPSSFVIPSTLGGNMKNVINLLSQFYYLLLISGRVRNFSVRKLLEWLWWKFHLAYCKKSVSLGLYINKLHLEHVCLFSLCK